MKPDFNRLYAAVTIPIVIAVALFFTFRQHDPEVRDSVVIGDDRFEIVGVAATPETRSTGLGGRDELCRGCALLFLFEQPARHTFWMKGMRFPIDIAWIRNRQIIHVEREVPAESKEVMTPPAEADVVIETNAGELAGVAVGDTVIFMP